MSNRGMLIVENLAGGRRGQIWRSEEGVHRPTGPWSKSVHRLLQKIHHDGFAAAPTFLRFDEQGREVLTFIPGIVGNDACSEAVKSQTALLSAARLLRAYHDASARALPDLARETGWQLQPQQPVEVICHGDFAPYNVVLNGNQAVGLIDFDVAHPASRVWDVAYAIYRWAPMTAPTNPEGFGSLDEQIERARLFCGEYGLSYHGSICEVICRRLNALISFMKEKAAADDQQYASHVAEGHLTIYLNDIAYISSHEEKIDRALMAFLS